MVPYVAVTVAFHGEVNAKKAEKVTRSFTESAKLIAGALQIETFGGKLLAVPVNIELNVELGRNSSKDCN